MSGDDNSTRFLFDSAGGFLCVSPPSPFDSACEGGAGGGVDDDDLAATALLDDIGPDILFPLYLFI